MLNKNPDKIRDVFVEPVNSILCHNAFTKQAIIQEIIEQYASPVIYLDFDLLYAGYVESGMIKRRQNLDIFRFRKKDWQYVLEKILIRISREDCIVVVDSLNGFFSMFDEKDSGRYVSSCIMMMSSLVKKSTGKVFLTSMAKLRDGRWILDPTGRYLPENRSIPKFLLDDPKKVQILFEDNSVQRIADI